LRRWLSILLLSYAALPGSALLPLAILASVPDAADDEPASLVLSPSREPDRYLRGDWEAPDSVVVAFAAGFSDFARLVALEASKIPNIEIAVLLGWDEYEEGYRWYGQNLADRLNVHLVPLELDSPWIRDYGPIQTYEPDGRALWLDARYASDRPADDRAPETLSTVWDVPLEQMGWSLQGGALIGNGFGLCASTLEAFEEYEIDPGDRDAIDALLTQIGCSVLVLVPALSDDNTRHIDMFAQFTSPDSIMIAAVDETFAPEDSERMDEAARGLLEAAATFGIELQVNRVPLPVGKEKQYYTYLNGLRLMDTFLVPSYRAVPVDEEREAYRALARAIPDASLVSVPADDMIELEGAVHCMTLGLNRR
jgi:agmatine/peptidylarginine deiminase